MAKIIYEIYQNQVEDHPSNGKYFARVKTIETLNTRKMANHIAEHGSIYTPDVIFGVLEKFRSCTEVSTPPTSSLACWRSSAPASSSSSSTHAR